MKWGIRAAELVSFLGALAAYAFLRFNLLSHWWADLHSDYALVGIMANHTLHGHFPIYYYGQNYMGGLEWLTAAVGARLLGEDFVTLEILRLNSFAWWLMAGAIWAKALRNENVLAAHLFAWLFAFGSGQLLQVSVLPELSPEYVFFGGLLFYLLRDGQNFSPRNLAVLGFSLGLGWWTNQSLIFFLVPAVVLFHAIPGRWHRTPLGQEFLTPERGLKFLYGLVAFLFFLGAVVALFGGIRWEQPIRLKIPNGISLARDAALVGMFAHLLLKFWRKKIQIAWLGVAPFAVGFLLGFSPVILGRIFGWYEKSYGVGLAILPIWKWKSQAISLFNNVLWILSTGNLLFLLPAAVGIVFALRKRDSLSVYFLLVAAFNIIYVFFSDRAEGAPLRYLYPVFVAATALVSVQLALIPRNWLKASLVCVLLVIGATHGIYANRLLESRAELMLPRRENLLKIRGQLLAEGHGTCWGDYWTSYLMAYLTEGKVVLSPHPDSSANQVRIKGDHQKVQAQNPGCFLYREDASATAEIFFSKTNPWRKP